MIYKICTLCGLKKSIDFYHKSKSTKDGRMHNCSQCNINRAKEYRKNNIDYVKEREKEYRKNNRDYFNLKTKKWGKKTGYFKKYQNERLKNDSFFRFKNRLRNLIRISITKNGYSKKTKAFNILCCEYDFFLKYISEKFTDGMTWDNHGDWHLDHIVPLATANTEEEIIKLNHYTNFQPLWAKDNLSKSSKIIEEQIKDIYETDN